MTQQSLAEKVGCTRQTIAAIEKAKYTPSLELAIMIARTLGKPIDEVFIVEDDMKPTDRNHAPRPEENR